MNTLSSFNTVDWILLAAVLLLIVGAIRLNRGRKQNSSCCSTGCSGCCKCSSGSKKKQGGTGA